jgi:hypothetical protein
MKTMTANVQLQNKTFGRQPQGAWHQEEIFGGKTATRKVTLSMHSF